MKKMVTMVAVALMMAGSAAFACGTCGCSAKKAENPKPTCTACVEGKVCAACPAAAVKKCPADCAKACCVKKAEA